MKRTLSRLTTRPKSDAHPDDATLLPRYLVQGAVEGTVAADLPCQLVFRPEEAFDGIIVAGDHDAESLAGLVRERRAWLAPVASLGRAPLPQADYREEGLGADGLAQAVAALAPIVQKMRQLPERALAAVDSETVLLARAYCRDGQITPAYEPAARELVVFPAAGTVGEPWRTLDSLAEEGAFRRTFFDRFHICPSCGSSRLNVREDCSVCASANLVEESTIHHFRCAHQDLERAFRHDDDLVCPKCRRTLRHIGVDYDKPSVAVLCRSCGHVDAEPVIAFVCIDCGMHSKADRVITHDWHGYELTSLGERWLFSGEDSVTRPRADDRKRAFRALLDHGLKIQSRYGRPAHVLKIRFTAIDDARLKDGDRAVANARKQAAEIVRGELRTSDFVVETDDGLLAYLPETGSDRAGIPRGRLIERIRDALPVDLGVEISAAELSEVAGRVVP